MTKIKPWVKNLYENTGHYPDNYTDERFLEQMQKNINLKKVLLVDCFLGSCRFTQKLSICVIFNVIFVYLYNEWISIEKIFTICSFFTFFGYVIFLISRMYLTPTPVTISHSISNQEIPKSPKANENIDEEYVNKLYKISLDNYSHRKKQKSKKNYPTSKPSSISNSKLSIPFMIFGDFKTVCIFLVFGYILSPILHSLTDTVSTDTIFATSVLMMLIHLIFSDYGISVALVSNSLSINAAIFGSICLASRLSTPFHAFVLLTISIQGFVLWPILIKLVLHTNFVHVLFFAVIFTAFLMLWFLSMTIFCFFTVAVLFLNFYCPILFVKWQKYKDNIYGPWDEAIVHDSDNVEDYIGSKAH